MKHTIPLILCLIVFAGCNRKHDDGTPVGAGGVIPGAQTTSVTKYGGSIQVAPVGVQFYRQIVKVNADVINYPSDSVNVDLCKNTDCSSGTIPDVQCSTVNNQPSAVCYASIPSVEIAMGHDSVEFINASGSGFTSYFIQTTVSR